MNSDMLYSELLRIANDNKEYLDENDVLDIYLAVSEDPEVGDPLEFTEMYLSTSREVLDDIDKLIEMIN